MAERKKQHPLPPKPEMTPRKAADQEAPEPERLIRPEEEWEDEPHLVNHPSQAEGERRED